MHSYWGIPNLMWGGGFNTLKIQALLIVLLGAPKGKLFALPLFLPEEGWQAQLRHPSEQPGVKGVEPGQRNLQPLSKLTSLSSSLWATASRLSWPVLSTDRVNSTNSLLSSWIRATRQLLLDTV
jgi:hypothetical protein